MKLTSKPISSPGRAEKYPPPLMRFLRSNVGSRSRGRSKSSPMFVRKKNTGNIETQEPSSPKVTCIGQVRVRRSQQPTNRARPGKRHCSWIRNALFCTHFNAKQLKPNKPFPSFPKCLLFLKRKVQETGQDSTSRVDFESSKNEEEDEDDSKKFVCSSFSSTPPKNALLLTRCRSAPYRSSSLASRFWGSPLAASDEEPKPEFESPTSETQQPTSTADQGNEENLGFCRKNFFEGGSISERSTKSDKIEELKKGEVCSVRPLILTRCKSEPARRTGEKLDPEANFWRNTSVIFHILGRKETVKVLGVGENLYRAMAKA